jgi:T5SS/PEP-CTERM-associated repeat protein
LTTNREIDLMRDSRLQVMNAIKTAARPRFSFPATLWLLFACAFFSVPVFAQTTIWTDATGNWFTPGNWDNGVPNAGTNAQINNGGEAQIGAAGATALNIILGNTAPDSGILSVTGPGTLAASGNLLVGGAGSGTLNITNGGAVSNLLGVIGAGLGSTGLVTVDGAGSTWTNSANLLVGDFGSATLNITNGGAVSNDIGEIAFQSDSTGTVTVDGTGSTWTNSGVLGVGNAGSGTLTIANGGTVSAVSVDLANQAGSTGTLNIGAAPASPAVAPGSLNTATVVFGAGGGTINFNHTATAYTFAPTISGGGAVNVFSGTTTLTAANTYTGATTVDGGTLLVNGSTSSSSTVTVNNSGTTLGGTGTIGGSVTVNPLATIAPGNGGNTTAILNTGALTLASTSNFLVDINGTTPGSGYDRLNVTTGAVTIGGSNLIVTVGTTLTIGQTFLVLEKVSAGAVSGEFAQGSMVTSGPYTFSINYAGGDDNDIVLTVTGVPEPGTWLGGTLALVALGFTQRKRLARALIRSGHRTRRLPSEI